jgi:hypothetical protein
MLIFSQARTVRKGSDLITTKEEMEIKAALVLHKKCQQKAPITHKEPARAEKLV